LFVFVSTRGNSSAASHLRICSLCVILVVSQNHCPIVVGLLEDVEFAFSNGAWLLASDLEGDPKMHIVLLGMYLSNILGNLKYFFIYIGCMVAAFSVSEGCVRLSYLIKG